MDGVSSGGGGGGGGGGGRPYFQWPQQLGRWNGSKFVVSPNCLSTLKLMDTKLREEATIKSQRIRRLLSKPETLKKNIIPVLIESTEVPPVFDPVVRLLVNVTTPLEELADADRCCQTRTGRNLLKRLSKISLEIKRTFLDYRTTQAVVKSLKAKAKKDYDTGSLSDGEITSITLNLTLIRNLLYVPDSPQCIKFRVNDQSLKIWNEIKNKIAWNLFIHGLDGILILMINSSHKDVWASAIVHIISLLYKDQDVSLLEKQLKEYVAPYDEGTSTEEDSKSNNSNETHNGDNSSGCDSGKSTEEGICDESKKGGSKLLDDQQLDSQECVTRKDIEESNKKREEKTESESCEGSGGGSSRSQEDSGFSQCDYNSSSPGSSGSNEGSQSDSPQSSNPCGGNGKADGSPDSSCSGENKQQQGVSCKDKTKKGSSSNSSSESGMSYSSNHQSSSSGSDDDIGGHTKEHIRHPQHKASSKHRAMHSADSPSNSDSSMEQDVHNRSAKQRSHVSRKAMSNSNSASQSISTKAQRFPCNPSVCLDAVKMSQRMQQTTSDMFCEKKKPQQLRSFDAECPSKEEIGNMMLSFTVIFLHSGFSTLVITLRVCFRKIQPKSLARLLVIENVKAYLDTKGEHSFYISWLVAYFIRLAVAMDLSLQHVKGVLSTDIIGLLVYESVSTLRSILTSMDDSQQRRNYQCVVKAIRELISSVDQFCSGDDKVHIFVPLVQMEDIRQSLLLLIRKPVEPHLSILTDAVVANHKLILLMEWANRTHDTQIDIIQHLDLFATHEVMDKYGDLLKNFRNNCGYVNQCILTMMHHVAVDLKHPETLLTPKILCSFVELVNEPSIQLPEHLEDFMNLIINYYLKQSRRARSSKEDSGEVERNRELVSRGQNENTSNNNICECNMSTDSGSDSSSCGSHPTQNSSNNSPTNSSSNKSCDAIHDKTDLLRYYEKINNEEDPMEQMMDNYKRQGLRYGRSEVLEQLVLLKMEGRTQRRSQKDIHGGRLYEPESGSQTSNDGDDMNSANSRENSTDQEADVPRGGSHRESVLVASMDGAYSSADSHDCLLKRLHSDGLQGQLLWLQKQLLEYTHVKLIHQYNRSSMGSAVEPLCLYSYLLDRDMPLVDFTCQQTNALHNTDFVSLASSIGLKMVSKDQLIVPRQLSMRQLIENASRLSTSPSGFSLVPTAETI